MALINALGALALEATQAERWGGGKTAFATTVANAGDNLLITPTSGKALRVVWVSAIPSPDSAANRLRFKFGTGGSPFYETYALAHWEPFQGGVNVPLYLNCQTTDPVSVTVHYREV